MIYRKPLVRIVWRPLLLGLALSGCTDAGLYQWKKDPYQANKLTVSGTVCTDDPFQRKFPVKVLFIIDTSGAVLANDPTGARGKAVTEFINARKSSPNYSWGIIAYGAKGRSLIPEGFTRDFLRVQAAASSTEGSGGLTGADSCIGGRCRDLRAAMSLASSVVTGDLLAGDPGEIARTTYQLILFAGGPPVPAIGRCNCRDKQTEGSCPWTDCDGCQVRCPQYSHCEPPTTCVADCYSCDDGTVCDLSGSSPKCGSGGGCRKGCQDPMYCDSTHVCQTPPDDPLFSPGKPVVPALAGEAISIPDTFSQRLIMPTETPSDGGTGNVSCPDISNIQALSLCHYDAATGKGINDSCEERYLVGMVRELREFAKQNGAAQLQLHSSYLSDEVDWKGQPPWEPPCGKDADHARAVRLLSEMAFAGQGGFRQFKNADAIEFASLDVQRSRDPLVIKELLVTNVNVLPDSGGTFVDTDEDGLIDSKETDLGTCPGDPDSDGDGISDAIEIKLARDPAQKDDPVECIDLKSTVRTDDDPCQPGTSKDWKVFDDRDMDGLNACEERLLGTSDSLMDSDADGIPDKVEFVAGTNFLSVDPLQDSDLDGVVNRDEIRGHTDPRSNDAQSQLDLAYRYEEVDEGVKDVLSFTQPATITGVTIKNVSSASSTGQGKLKFVAGPPPTLSWVDGGDAVQGGSFGPPIDVSRPVADGYKLSSCRKTTTGACTPESLERFITVMVEGTGNYPPSDRVETIVVSSARRNCLRFRVRNITLMETGMNRDLKTTGNNKVMVYFAEAPQGAKDGYGIFRVREITLNYHKGPPEIRTPKAAEITIGDDDFEIVE